MCGKFERTGPQRFDRIGTCLDVFVCLVVGFAGYKLSKNITLTLKLINTIKIQRSK